MSRRVRAVSVVTTGRWLVTAVVARFLAVPIAYLLSVSFKTKDDTLSGSFLPSVVTFDNWPQAFISVPLITFIGNSVMSSVLAGLLTLAITLPAAYATLRLGVGGKWLPQITLSSYMAPPVVALIPLFYLLKQIGLINSVAGLVLVYGCVNVPVAFWLLTPFLRRVPIDIEHAAALDGAGPLRILWSIVLPLVRPGIVATLIIVVILAYNEFLLASSFAFGDATRTLTVGISLFQGDRLVNFGQMAVASLTGIAPVYLIALFMQRHLVSGLAHGGVK